MLHIIPRPITNTASGTHTTWYLYCTKSCFCRAVSTDSTKLQLNIFRKNWATDFNGWTGRHTDVSPLPPKQRKPCKNLNIWKS